MIDSLAAGDVVPVVRALLDDPAARLARLWGRRPEEAVVQSSASATALLALAEEAVRA